MTDSGDRVPGLIDKFKAEIDVRKIIARVAHDYDVSDRPGESIIACKLYTLAGVSFIVGASS
jgi:hypothetical protein